MDNNHLLQTKRQRVTTIARSGSGDVDRISSLPDNLLLHILDLLPTEETIPTAVLSKRWRCMWKQVRRLKFDSKLHQKRFSDHVIDALITYQNPAFESLSLTVSYDCDPTELAIWLGIALLKDVSKVVFCLNYVGQAFEFPRYALGRRNTLRILELMGNINFDLPVDSVSLLCLKELHLHNVSFENENSVACLFEGCPVLEELVLVIFIRSGVSTLIINVPSLLRLTVESRYCDEENIVIQSPRLKYLNTKQLDGVDSFIIENAPEIIEATITRHEENMFENILATTTLVHCLSLYAPLKQPAGKIYASLTTLALDTKEHSWCNLLSYMLACSPQLQILKLVGGLYHRWLTVWIEPQHVATCLITHLHTVIWENLIWDGADDREVAKHILKHAAKLRNVTITTLEPPTDAENQHRQIMLTLLANVERASPLWNLVFKESSISNFSNRSLQDPNIEDFAV